MNHHPPKISSTFSRHTSPILKDLPEIIPSTPAQIPAPNPLPIPLKSKAEDPLELDWSYLDVMEGVEEGDSGDHSLRHNTEISNGTDGAQP